MHMSLPLPVALYVGAAWHGMSQCGLLASTTVVFKQSAADLVSAWS